MATLETCKWIGGASTVKLRLLIILLAVSAMLAGSATAAMDVRVTIRIVSNNTGDTKTLDPGDRGLAKLAILRESLDSTDGTAKQADGGGQAARAGSGHNHPGFASHAELESCFRQLPTRYVELHAKRFAAAWPGASDCFIHQKLLENWQRLNASSC